MADYLAIFWLNSKDEDLLKQSFANVARRVLQDYASPSQMKKEISMKWLLPLSGS